MQPPSRTATPTSAKDNPLTRISSSFQAARRGHRIELVLVAIKRKIRAIATISRPSTAACRDLLHECRTRLSTPRTVPFSRPAERKKDFADKALREGLL
jgi:hypothetical protein